MIVQPLPTATRQKAVRTAPPRRWTDPFVLIALAAIVFGAAATTWQARALPADDSSEAGFAWDMTTHHEQAVEMAEIVRGRTQNAELRVLAIDIALTQHGQVGQMRGWLDVWGLLPTGRQPPMTWMGMPTTGLMPGMATPTEINALRDAPLAQADEQFLRLMIRHHRAGVDMAQGAIGRTGRREVLRLAGAVIAAQQSEIMVMQDSLRRAGLAPEPDPPTSSATHQRDHIGGAQPALFSAAAVSRWLPGLLALAAATWLVLDTVVRCTVRADIVHVEEGSDAV